MADQIKTWEQRADEKINRYSLPGNVRLSDRECMLAEIAELRAALQAQQGDARDAARWRGLRDLHNNGDTQWFIYGAPTFITDGDVDAALAARREG